MNEGKHRVVIDTNLWISFLLTRDFTKLDRLPLTNQVILLVSQYLLTEIVEVAEQPKFIKHFDLSDLSDLIITLQQKTELVELHSQITIAGMQKIISCCRLLLMALLRIFLQAITICLFCIPLET